MRSCPQDTQPEALKRRTSVRRLENPDRKRNWGSKKGKSLRIGIGLGLAAMAALVWLSHRSQTGAARLPVPGPVHWGAFHRTPRADAESVSAPAVLTGLEVLRKEGFAPLQGRHVGLITNPTGVAADLRSTIDLLAHAPGVHLVALYGPEHGVRGDAAAGASVSGGRDPETGLPVYSLYGATRKPTPAMLRGVDTLVFDIQDIGARSYTYISTLGLCMESAAENHLRLVVLDRPDPLGGERVEGNLPTSAFRSFVGRYPIPYVYGLTVGELAQMINGEGWLADGRQCDLTVIPMQGYRRDMTWAETGLPWVPTSPHIPHPDTALYYAATGIAGELPALSIGVGYTLPFELAGAPGLSPTRFAAELNRRKLPGVLFRPMSWSPFYATYQSQTCGGVQIYFFDPAHVTLTRLNFEIMDAARRLLPRLRFFPTAERAHEFDLVCGTDQVRRQFLAGRSAAEIWNAWNAGSAVFRAQRRPYLLYPPASPAN